METYEELFALSKKLADAAGGLDIDSKSNALHDLLVAATEVGKSFSGSWLGYHSRVYYDGLEIPPPGAHFSQEWGLKDMSYTSFGSRGEWREFDADSVKAHIFKMANDPNIDSLREQSMEIEDRFAECKSDIESILVSELEETSDAFIERLKDELAQLEPLTPHQVADRMAPKGQKMTRDTVVLGQGTRVPPHFAVIADVRSIQHSFGISDEASKIAQKAASHLQRKTKRAVTEARIGTNVFIGHGQSTQWRDLKDFLQDRLALPWDEFNRVPVAGVTNIARLSEMLESAALAFLVMTAEDEMADGAKQARMNVIHEAGLFQGRLGFNKAIVVLEEGCEEFSNIQGLGQIRFPKGNISAVFEEIRQVLEREDLISS